MSHIDSEDFFTPTPFNNTTKQQIWMSMIADAHDNICHCWHPFAHLLANIFPPGHKDRDLTINQILERDLKEKWHSGGEGGENSGGAAEKITSERKDSTPPEKEPTEEEEIDGLLAAAADDAERR